MFSQKYEVMTEASGQQVWLMKTVFRGSRRGLFFSSVAEMEKCDVWWKDSSSSCSISSLTPSHTSSVACGGSRSQTVGRRHSDINMSSCLLLRLQPTCWSTRCASPSPSSTRCRASGSSAAPSASCCPTPRGSPCTSPRWRSTSSPWTATGGWGLKMGGGWRWLFLLLLFFYLLFCCFFFFYNQSRGDVFDLEYHIRF